MKSVLVVFCLSVVHANIENSGRKDVYFPQGVQEESAGKLKNQNDAGKPLFLTSLIRAGKIKRAQRLSKVQPDIGNITSYSGFLTTNKRCGNNLFFWFFPAQEDWDNAPVVLWLQGGPGGSSMFGLFKENGPFNHFHDGLKKREYSWNVKNNLLFVDQPVGTGYSFTKKGCYVKDETGIREDLYSALIQFLQLFPNLQQNKFFLTGESYAGHFIPGIGLKIHNENRSAKLKINLAGIMIGGGWMDAREQMKYGDYLYQVGLIDDNEREEFYTLQELHVKQIDADDWNEALETEKKIYDLFYRYANVSIYNYLPQPPDESDYEVFIENSNTRKSIHVGDFKYVSLSNVVLSHLSNDRVQSVKPWVEILLEYGYPIVFYVGQVDVICAYPMVINILHSLVWSGQEQYLNAKRSKWFEGNELAGYIKRGKNLADVLVRGAGHLVPQDQPFWSYQLVNRFTSGGIHALIDDNSTSYIGTDI